MTPIGSLIEEVQRLFLDTHGVELTYGDIARRSAGRLTRQRVQQLAKDPIKAMPSPESVYGLALGLALPESVVLERALASSGYYRPRDGRREEVSSGAAKTEPVDTPTGAPYQQRRVPYLEAQVDQMHEAVEAHEAEKRKRSTTD